MKLNDLHYAECGRLMPPLGHQLCDYSSNYSYIAIEQATSESRKNDLINVQTKAEYEDCDHCSNQAKQDDWLPAIDIGRPAPGQPSEEGSERVHTAHQSTILRYLFLIVGNFEISDHIIKVREDRGERYRLCKST